MFRHRGENLRSVFVLLFLNVAFFLLQHQDPARYARVFAFRWDAVQSGEVWRVVTYQFRQPGSGIMEALWLFVTMLLLYIMGTTLEEEWGTVHLITIFSLSTLASAAVAAYLGIPLLGTYFVNFTLLYVYASVSPRQFGLMPFPVWLLAVLSLGYLLYGVFAGGRANIAMFSGALAGYIYYLSQRIPASQVAKPNPPRVDNTALQNAARFAGIRKAVANRSVADIDRLIAQSEREIIPNVNICPPADYKPEHNDGYCIRCEGFAECSARYLRNHRPASAPRAEAAYSPEPPPFPPPP